MLEVMWTKFQLTDYQDFVSRDCSLLGEFLWCEIVTATTTQGGPWVEVLRDFYTISLNIFRLTKFLFKVFIFRLIDIFSFYDNI